MVATLLPVIAPILVLVQSLIPQDAQQSPASNLAVTVVVIAAGQAAAIIVTGPLAISSIPLFSVLHNQYGFS